VSNDFKNVFNAKAWAYAVMYHGVGIGLWCPDKQDLIFHPNVEFDWEDVTELRVFDEEKELRFVRNENGELKERNSADIKYDEVRCAEYLMYGTDASPEDEWTILTEDRGGELYFPTKLKDLKLGSEKVMWLGIRNYLRFTEDLRLEVCDYAFTGFKSGMDKQGVDL